MRWTEHTSPGGAPAASAPSSAGGQAPPTGSATVFVQALVLGLAVGTVAGLASGTAAAPVLGTIVGAFVGALAATPIALLAAWAISAPVKAGAPPAAYRRRVDVVLVVLAVATAALAVGWISLEPLVGPWPAITMLVVVVLGLVVARIRLRRLVPPG